MQGNAPPSVLFVCVQNAGRSQMSEAWARALGGDRVVAASAGSRPADAVHDNVVTVMREVGIDLSDRRPQGLDELDVAAFDVVVTMGCGDACPYVPGTRYLDWELPDPHGQGLDAVRATRDDIRRRIADLLDELDVGVADVPAQERRRRP